MAAAPQPGEIAVYRFAPASTPLTLFLSLVPKRRIPGRRLRLTTRQDRDNPTPTFVPVANDVAQRLALEPVAQRRVCWGRRCSTCRSPPTCWVVRGSGHTEHGVVDREHRVFGYQNLFVCDGAVIPANPGVNQSMTITAMAERAMAAIPVKAGAQTTTPRVGSISTKPAAV